MEERRRRAPRASKARFRRRRGSGLVGDAVAQDAEAVDLDLDDVAGFSQSGGLRLAPTPPGVPVAMTSPGSSRVKDEQYSMIFGISKIIWSKVASCTTWPLTRVWRRRSGRGPSSSGVIIHGPKAPVSGKFLPGVNWWVWRWKSRTLPSL